MRTILYAITYVGLAAAGFFGTTLCCQQAGPTPGTRAEAAAPSETRQNDDKDEPKAYRCRAYHIMTMGDMCYWYMAECPSGTNWSSEINTCTVPFGPCCGPPACAHCADFRKLKNDSIEPSPLGKNGLPVISKKATVSVGITEKIHRSIIIEFEHPETHKKIKAHLVLVFTKPFKDDIGGKHKGFWSGVGRQMETEDTPDVVDGTISDLKLVENYPKLVEFKWNEDQLPPDVPCMVVLAQD